MKRLIDVVAVCLLVGFVSTSPLAQATEKISASQAADYIGDTATVCGKVASTNYASGARGQPTFLNLGKPYPDHEFTALIWGENRSKFDTPPEQAFDKKNICVKGRISSYRGKPQIMVTTPSQIMIDR